MEWMRRMTKKMKRFQRGSGVGGGKDVPEEAENFTLKGFLEVFHDFENAKDKTLEVDPDLGRNMTVH